MTRREVTAVLKDCPEYGLMDGYCILSLQTPGWNFVRPSAQPEQRWIPGEPMNESERKTMMILADTLKGEINRMCVTKELSELDTMYGHAKKNLDKLSKMIYEERFMAERRTNEAD
jgi:hypothetical protein